MTNDCGNQRSVKSTTSGALIEDHVLEISST